MRKRAGAPPTKFVERGLAHTPLVARITPPLILTSSHTDSGDSDGSAGAVNSAGSNGGGSGTAGSGGGTAGSGGGSSGGGSSCDSCLVVIRPDSSGRDAIVRQLAPPFAPCCAVGCDPGSVRGVYLPLAGGNSSEVICCLTVAGSQSFLSLTIVDAASGAAVQRAEPTNWASTTQPTRTTQPTLVVTSSGAAAGLMTALSPLEPGI